MSLQGQSTNSNRHGRRWLAFAVITIALAGVIALSGRERTSARFSSSVPQGTPQKQEHSIAAGARSPAPSERSTNRARMTPNATNPDARARARAALATALPEWDDSINRLEEGEVSDFDPTAQDPLALAKLVSKQTFAFSEVRKNGRTVYKNAAQDSVVKEDKRAGYWKYISPLKIAPDGKLKLSDQQAETEARSLFDEFDLPAQERGRIRSAGIAGGGEDGEVQVMARNVHMQREVKGLPVAESEFTVTYNPDGSVARCERRWPSFELDGADVADREEAINHLSETLESDLSQEGTEAGATLLYVRDEKTGVHEPILRVHVQSKDEDKITRTVEYSLKDRMVEEGAEGEEHDS